VHNAGCLLCFLGYPRKVISCLFLAL